VSNNEHDGEPIRGLPGYLPAGEHILWQGSPDWRTLARSAMKAHWVALYFGGLVTWNLVNGLATSRPIDEVALTAVFSLLAGLVCVGLLVGYAWANARTTVYTLTNKRFVLRHGVALSKCFNIPYPTIASAQLKVDEKGVGDIPISLGGGAKIAYPHLWPHARPWKFVSPQPMMRALPDAAAVAERLSVQLQIAARAADKPFVAESARPATVRPGRAKSTDGQPATA
jgi:hypothetical protein